MESVGIYHQDNVWSVCVPLLQAVMSLGEGQYFYKEINSFPLAELQRSILHVLASKTLPINDVIICNNCKQSKAA